MIFPEDPLKDAWDLLVAFLLVGTCLILPYRIALVEKDNLTWKIVTNIVDFFFLMDIIVIFNTAYYDEDYNMIQSRKTIFKSYVQGWFIIDFFAVIPFDYLFEGSNLNSLIRVARIGKMYKLVKLTKLLRMAKFVKNSSYFGKYMQKIFNIGFGMQRLMGFILSFFVLIHIVSCLWIMTAQFADEAKGTWMEGDIFLMGSGEKYLTSIYFTVTTITTVGYGDVSISTKTEKFFCILTMLVGVISFSFASGSLSSILQSIDSTNAKHKGQLAILNKLLKDYKLPLRLYSHLKQSLNY
jgi:potassium voltage-gated channel Eag-related subfamily H protein 8